MHNWTIARCFFFSPASSGLKPRQKLRQARMRSRGHSCRSQNWDELACEDGGGHIEDRTGQEGSVLDFGWKGREERADQPVGVCVCVWPFSNIPPKCHPPTSLCVPSTLQPPSSQPFEPWNIPHPTIPSLSKRPKVSKLAAPQAPFCPSSRAAR